VEEGVTLVVVAADRIPAAAAEDTVPVARTEALLTVAAAHHVDLRLAGLRILMAAVPTGHRLPRMQGLPILTPLEIAGLIRRVADRIQPEI